MDDLTQRLTTDQPVIVGGANPSVEELRQRVFEMGYVLIKFTETRGGTELGVRLDTEATNTEKADFDHGTGIVHIEGTLTLNGDHVRCFADIDLTALKGTGRLALAEVHSAAVS